MNYFWRIGLTLTAVSCGVAGERSEGEVERQSRAAGKGLIEPVTESTCNHHDLNCRSLNSKGRAEGRRLIEGEKAAAIIDSYGGHSISNGVGLLWWEYLAEGVGWQKLEIRDSGNIVLVRRYYYDWGQQKWIEYAAQAVDSVNGNWARSDYSGPAAAMGVANNQAFRNRADGSVVRLLNSDVGSSIMKAGLDSMIGAGILQISDDGAKLCHSLCSGKAGRKGLWIALGGAGTCAVVGLVVGGLPGAALLGFSCSVVGGLVGFFGTDSNQCFSDCVSCFNDAQRNCTATGRSMIPRDTVCSGVFFCDDTNGDGKGDTIRPIRH